MVLYNTFTGVLAGLLLLLSARLVVNTNVYDANREPLRPYGVGLLAAGIPLTIASAIGMFTEPLTANQPINIAFWQPKLMLGILAVTGGILILVVQNLLEYTQLLWGVFTTGAVMLVIALAILRFNLVGDAPPFEPITGQATGWENTAFGIVFIIAALGCLATPFANRPQVRRVIFWLWVIAGAAFLVFSVLNFYTHIGMEVNLIRFGTDHPDQWYRW